jgi:HEAT repeat protein
MMFWSFRNAPPARSLPTETAVLRLRMIPEALAAREALELAQEENFELLVAWLLEDRSFGIPYKVLRESGSAKAAERVIALLDSPDSDIRARAAAVLGPLGGERAAIRLCSILPKATGNELNTIANALERLACKGAVDPLMRALEGANERHAMTSLVGALRKCGAETYSVFQALIRGLSRGDAMAFECVAALFDLQTLVLLQKSSCYYTSPRVRM